MFQHKVHILDSIGICFKTVFLVGKETVLK